MSDQSHLKSSDQHPSFPDCQQMAVIVAALFRRLGGHLAIGPDCSRQMGSPLDPDMVEVDLIGPDGLPQLPGSAPSEQFQNDDEWRGAIKFARYWLARLSDADKEFVFTLSPTHADSRKPFDFRDHLH